MSRNINLWKPRGKQWSAYNLRPGSLSIFGKLELGTAGAVESYSSMAGVRSVVRVSTGLYTINLMDKYYASLAHFCCGVRSSGTDGYNVNVVSDAFVDGNEGVHADVNERDGYVQIQVVDQADAAADPIDCDLYLNFVLKTSSRG